MLRQAAAQDQQRASSLTKLSSPQQEGQAGPSSTRPHHFCRHAVLPCPGCLDASKQQLAMVHRQPAASTAGCSLASCLVTQLQARHLACHRKCPATTTSVQGRPAPLCRCVGCWTTGWMITTCCWCCPSTQAACGSGGPSRRPPRPTSFPCACASSRTWCRLCRCSPATGPGSKYFTQPGEATSGAARFGQSGCWSGVWGPASCERAVSCRGGSRVVLRLQHPQHPSVHISKEQQYHAGSLCSPPAICWTARCPAQLIQALFVGPRV